MTLELKNIAFGFSEPLITTGNLLLHSGDVCLIIGDNGVGKTTLIKSILGQNKLSSGEILLDQKNIGSLDSKQLAQEISIVFSKSQLPSNYTVTDLISFGKYIHYPYYFKLNQTDRNEVQEIIEKLGLKEYANFELQHLSDGNLQKAFIGRALAQNTAIIILDEPTTHLDEKNKLMILNLLRQIAKHQNKIILFSSHDWRLAKEFSDKICLLKDRQLFTGIAEDVLLENKDLTIPNIFPFSSEFKAPKISAPELQKELLYSFLQKNHQKNLEDLTFIWKEQFWEIYIADKQYKSSNFKEISQLLKNHH